MPLPTALAAAIACWASLSAGRMTCRAAAAVVGLLQAVLDGVADLDRQRDLAVHALDLDPFLAVLDAGLEVAHHPAAVLLPGER